MALAVIGCAWVAALYEVSGKTGLVGVAIAVATIVLVHLLITLAVGGFRAMGHMVLDIVLPILGLIVFALMVAVGRRRWGDLR